MSMFLNLFRGLLTGTTPGGGGGVTPPPPDVPFPIYVDSSLILCTNTLTAPEIAVFQARLDAVSTRYKLLGAAPHYTTWKAAYDALSPADKVLPILGVMEDPWQHSILSFNSAYNEGIGAGYAATALADAIASWAANSNVQAEFLRQGVNGGYPTIAQGGIVDADLPMYRQVATTLYLDANAYVSSNSGTRCSQFSNCGISPFEGTTRLFQSLLHNSSPVSGKSWHAADGTFYLSLEDKIQLAGNSLALTSLAGACNNAAHMSPWVIQLYGPLPTSAAYDSMIALWTMGDASMHRYLGTKIPGNIVDPPDFNASDWRYWVNSFYQRVLPATSAAWMAHGGFSFDDPSIYVEPVITPGPTATEYGDAPSVFPFHAIGLFETTPATRAAIYTKFFVPETDIANPAYPHVYPKALWIWDSSEFYWITKPTSTYSGTQDQKMEIASARIGMEKMFLGRPLIGVGELVGDTDKNAMQTWQEANMLSDTLWKLVNSGTVWRTSGGVYHAEIVAAGLTLAGSPLTPYLNFGANITGANVFHAIAMWVSEYNTAFVEALASQIDGYGF